MPLFHFTNTYTELRGPSPGLNALRKKMNNSVFQTYMVWSQSGFFLLPFTPSCLLLWTTLIILDSFLFSFKKELSPEHQVKCPLLVSAQIRISWVPEIKHPTPTPRLLCRGNMLEDSVSLPLPPLPHMYSSLSFSNKSLTKLMCCIYMSTMCL